MNNEQLIMNNLLTLEIQDYTKYISRFYLHNNLTFNLITFNSTTQ